MSKKIHWLKTLFPAKETLQLIALDESGSPSTFCLALTVLIHSA